MSIRKTWPFKGSAAIKALTFAHSLSKINVCARMLEDMAGRLRLFLCCFVVASALKVKRRSFEVQPYREAPILFRSYPAVDVRPDIDNDVCPSLPHQEPGPTIRHA